jgi:hypothetical protein
VARIPESKQIPASHRLPKLLDRRQVSGHGLTVRQFDGVIVALGDQEI